MARGEIEGTRPVWEEWILAESKRRYFHVPVLDFFSILSNMTPQ